MHAQRHRLTADRWHFQHGPIDLVIQADGAPGAVAAAHERAWQRFAGVLPELVAELPALRTPVGPRCTLSGVVARRMWQACVPFHPEFITPMAAVAGAVAQEVLQAYAHPGIRRAWVNNGGDIALHLADGAAVRVGVCANVQALRADAGGLAVDLDGTLAITQAMPVRGVATSGWRGRSQSLGIADSVTVLAPTAAQADAAATMVANAVDVDAPGIERAPACAVKDDSDLGARLVTVAVPPLAPALVQQALQRGLQAARRYQRAGQLWAAVLSCQGRFALLPPVAAQSPVDTRAAPLQPLAVGSVFA